MILIKNTEVFGFDHAIRGMRNPLNSWGRSDSEPLYTSTGLPVEKYDYKIGPNDLDLMRRLYKAGTEHRKFMRMITVYVDITAPLYWWKEFDTYKVGTVANSCSTMHKIAAKEFVLDDFSHEHLGADSIVCLNTVIKHLNAAREDYINEGRNKDDWWQMIQLLPSSYNQKRTIMLNYEVLASICQQRKGHKLDEWKNLYTWAMCLPYMADIMGESIREERFYYECY